MKFIVNLNNNKGESNQAITFILYTFTEQSLVEFPFLFSQNVLIIPLGVAPLNQRFFNNLLSRGFFLLNFMKESIISKTPT